LLPALSATQIVSWGVLYYAFPVLAPAITADAGWSLPTITAAFSSALLTSALTGIPLGRIVDRRGPHAVMTIGSVVAVVALGAVACAPSLPVFFAAWMLAGGAMAASFYQPAFAALTRWYAPGQDRIRALTILTLAGGLASTVFAPLAAALNQHLNWRTTYLILAAILALVAIPLHAFALCGPWPSHSGMANTKPNRTHPDEARTHTFIFLASALTLSAFALYTAMINLIPLLSFRGASTTAAAWALGLNGLGQVLGRTAYSSLARHMSVGSRTTVLIAAGGATTAVLAAVPGPLVLLVGFAVLAGAVRGNLTLLQATAVSDRWGTVSYARRSALLAAPVTVATALAPFAGTALAGPLGGYPQMFGFLSLVSMLAAALALGTGSTPRQGQQPQRKRTRR
jgi:MFS family permease